MAGMKARDVLIDHASRPAAALDKLPCLSSYQLNVHPLGHSRSIAWLLWRAGRNADVRLSELTGAEQLWTADGWVIRAGLVRPVDCSGDNHTRSEAFAVQADSDRGLKSYILATMDALTAYALSTTHKQLGEVIDATAQPQVTRAGLLTGIIDHTLEHIAQAAYIAGMPELAR